MTNDWRRISQSMLRGLAWFHRWSGIALCLFFVVWFASGLVMVFTPFPALSDVDRRMASDPIALVSLAVSPSVALERGGGGPALRLVSVSGRPVYVAGETTLRAIDGVTGAPRAPLTAAEARVVASRFAGRPAAQVTGPFAYDQWVVHNRFDPWRPFYRVSLRDAGGAELYVSAVTGEVVQRTRFGERAWNWVGAVPHWLYFTIIRRDWPLWDNAIWTLALAGLAAAAAGTWLGILRTQKRLKSRKPDWSPFRGWLRWHHGLGLAAAAFVLAWILSGWLSMDHGRLFSRGTVAPEVVAAYRGADLGQAFADIGPAAVTALGPAREVRFHVVDGRPVIVAWDDHATRTTVVGGTGGIGSQLPAAFLAAAATRHWPLRSSTAQGPGPEDRLYRTADGLATTAQRYDLISPKGASLYIDAVSGQPVALIDPSRKAYAWVYYALHTFKFPGLDDRPVLRRTIQIVPLLLGLIFSLTGVVIGVRRLLGDLSRARHRSIRSRS